MQIISYADVDVLIHDKFSELKYNVYHFRA